jgi:hypothetical protein
MGQEFDCTSSTLNIPRYNGTLNHGSKFNVLRYVGMMNPESA